LVVALSKMSHHWLRTSEGVGYSLLRDPSKGSPRLLHAIDHTGGARRASNLLKAIVERLDSS
jgi:hypothetical protein